MNKSTFTTKDHPCFNKEAKSQYGRVHLPIAPKCNISCNYCNRKYDCVNESRPGVSSSLLSPQQAVGYLEELTGIMPNISVVGIAGPGDPFANAEETLETLRLIKKVKPELIICLSTNGLKLEPYIDELVELGVSHVTITLNSLDVEVLSKMYAWVRYGKKVYRGKEAAEILLTQQLKALQKLSETNIITKVNTIVIPGINDKSIEPIAIKAKESGVTLMNCVPLYPVKDTPFEDINEPNKGVMSGLRNLVAKYLKPMTHCARCRADAAGLLSKDHQNARKLLREYSVKPVAPGDDRPYVAVASYEGMLVNEHLGEAKELYVFEETKNGFRLKEQRKTPPPGYGNKRWEELATMLNDCRAILVSGVGPKPMEILKKGEIRVVQMTGLIDTGLDHVFKGTILNTINKQDAFKCGSSCMGNAQGCA